MPDNWEFPWYASWDLAFHMLPFAEIDPEFAKEQLILLLREWYTHPSGQLPAYEFAFGDVNPPVHAWAAYRVYKISAPRGQRDRAFLERVFQKSLINFTWWVNRKDIAGKQIFSGGFLGLDNVGIFDRSKPLPNGSVLEQADGSAWMAFYCTTMLAMALELASEDPAYEDVASKFFEHFVAITDAMNTLGGTGLWDEDDGFYYDQVRTTGGGTIPVKVRSAVGLIPLIAVTILEQEVIERLPGFNRRLQWFLNNRRDLYQQISLMEVHKYREHSHRLLAIPTRARLLRVLSRVLDEREFLSPYGIRSLSAVYGEHPYELRLDGEPFGISYDPGESTSGIFGGNSNWRGPIWMPINYLYIEALERYYHFYGDELQSRMPDGFRQIHEPAGGFARAQPQAVLALSARFTGLGAVAGGRWDLCQRPALARSDALQRILPRGDRARLRGVPPDRLDGADCAVFERSFVGIKVGSAHTAPLRSRLGNESPDSERITEPRASASGCQESFFIHPPC